MGANCPDICRFSQAASLLLVSRAKGHKKDMPPCFFRYEAVSLPAQFIGNVLPAPFWGFYGM